MQRVESQNNTPEQARAYLQGALELVAEIDPPEELRETFFTKAVELLAAKQVAFVQPQPVPVDLAKFGRKQG